MGLTVKSWIILVNINFGGGEGRIKGEKSYKLIQYRPQKLLIK
jgi:hypothetical protein